MPFRKLSNHIQTTQIAPRRKLNLKNKMYTKMGMCPIPLKQ